MPRGTRCTAHIHHRPVPEENHHLQPQSRGGRTVRANMRYLCANAHSDVHYFLDLIERNALTLVGTGAGVDEPVDMIPWVEARTYAHSIRETAIEGWERYGREFLAGEYRRHAALWTTDGQPRPDAEERLGFWPSIGVGTSVLRMPYSRAADGWAFGDFDAEVREAKPLR